MKSLRGGRIFSDERSVHGKGFDRLKTPEEPGDYSARASNSSAASTRDVESPTVADSSPTEVASSPFAKSPWSCYVAPVDESFDYSPNVLMGSLVREEGHIYSLAASGDLLYTGSDSKNIRVWKNQKEFSGFKSNSGLVKAIIISGEKIFTGHQDGKIRVWRVSSRNGSIHKRVGNLPTLRDYIKCSLNPSNYVEVRRHRNVLWIKHFDAISCLSLSEDKSLLYSSSWDKTFKVWRISDFKCLESVIAHEDAVNAIVAGFDSLVFTGSADGTVKAWRREYQGKGTKHFFSQMLLKQEYAVTALAINSDATVVYSGSSDGLVNYWDREKHLSHGGVLRCHKLAVLCLTAAGRLVLSGSADKGICVWRRDGGDHTCLSVLTGHTGPVKCLAAEKDHDSQPSGERRWIVYSGSLDKSVKMWRVSEAAPPMQRVHQHYTSDGNAMPTNLPYAPSFSTQGRISQKKS